MYSMIPVLKEHDQSITLCIQIQYYTIDGSPIYVSISTVIIHIIFNLLHSFYMINVSGK